MKLASFDKTLSALEHLEEQEEIVLEGALAERARLPLERMLLLAQ